MAQVWSLVVLQVSPDEQLAIGVQLEQVVSLVPEQPPEANWPAAQVEHAGQLSTVPLTRRWPLAQVAHCESLPLSQLIPEVQLAIDAHVVQLAVPLP